MLDPVISNVRGALPNWSAFTILDAGGDAMRWARRAFHEKAYDYDRIVSLAASAPAGAGMLLFLPYLSGERLGARTNARAQFIGLTSGHGAAHLHRAVMEGVAFAAARNLRIMELAGNRLDRMVAAGGGAKTRLWLEIKASLYGCPILTTAAEECSILGCAMLAGTGVGLVCGPVRGGVQAGALHGRDPAQSALGGHLRAPGAGLRPSLREQPGLLDHARGGGGCVPASRRRQQNAECPSSLNTRKAAPCPHSYLDKYDLTGRIAVVTGGGRGIGHACAEALAEAGARIVLLDRDETAAGGRRKPGGAGADVSWHLVDVTRPGRPRWVGRGDRA